MYKADDVVLSFTVQVQNAPVTLAHAPLCIDHIEIAGGGCSKLIQMIYGEDIFYNLLALSEEQMDGVSKVIGLTPDFLSSLNVIPAGSQRALYCPLNGNVFSQSKLYIEGIQEDLRIRIYFISASEHG